MISYANFVYYAISSRDSAVIDQLWLLIAIKSGLLVVLACCALACMIIAVATCILDADVVAT